jgi:glutaredoxin
VQVLTRDGCHLCEVATAELSRLGVAFAEVDVDADPRLRAEHGDYVPVVLLDGRQVAWGRVDAARVARLVARTAERPAGRWRPW